MGYTTEFRGRFQIEPPLTAAQVAYLCAFNETRRMKRNAALTALRSDPLRVAVALPLGEAGEFFVGEEGFAGQHEGPDVVDGNGPPPTQPGPWCQWRPTDDGHFLEWDGNEKFYDYTEWLDYMIGCFFRPWGCVLNGQVAWFGEDHNDVGRLVVRDNKVSADWLLPE